MNITLKDCLSAIENRDGYWSVISGLVPLIKRTRTHERVGDPIERAGSHSNSSNDAVVLDDVAPVQTQTDVALNNCNLRLREALHLLFLRPRKARFDEACGTPMYGWKRTITGYFRR